MPNHCTVRGCLTNYKGQEQGSVFLLPKNEAQKTQWLKFLNFPYIASLKNVYVCFKHFEPNLLLPSKKGVKLNHTMNPVPTLVPAAQKSSSLPPTSVVETIKCPRNPPKERIFQEDELGKFKKRDTIKDLNDITERKLNELGSELSITRNSDHIVIYRLETDSAIPVVTFCIRIESNLRVSLFYKNNPVPLPEWFCKGRNTYLTSFSMLGNFVSYIKNKTEETGIQEELEKLKHYSNPLYPNHIIRFAIQLRYTSLQAYNLMLEELPLPSISHLRNLTSGELNFGFFNIDNFCTSCELLFVFMYFCD